MARTRTQLRQLTAQRLSGGEIRWPITGTADAGGSTTVLRDSPLQVYVNDKLISAHIFLTSGSPTFTELEVTDSAQANGDLTFRPTLGAAPDTLTYEVLPFSATEIHRALDDAMQILYTEGRLIREFWMWMVAGSPIWNADWSFWDSATVVNGWTLTGSTLARERNSGNTPLTRTAVALSGATGTLDLDAVWRRWLWDFAGETITLYCPVRTSTASKARINLISNGVNNYSAYHSGTNRWELLSQQLTTGVGDTEIRPQLVNDSATGTAYFGMPWIKGPNKFELPFNVTLMPSGPRELRAYRPVYSDNEFATERGSIDVVLMGRPYQVVEFDYRRYHGEASTEFVSVLDLSRSNNAPLNGDHLLVLGDGPLTLPAANADNVEVTQTESMVLATKAAIILLQKAQTSASEDSRRRYQVRIQQLEQDLDALAPGVVSDRKSAALRLRW